MKTYTAALLTVTILFLSAGCKRDVDDLELAQYPTTAEVFIDGFSAGLDYSAYGDSFVAAFSVDKEEKYKGTASMRFEVPDADNAKGSYAGGQFIAEVGRDLSGYNALTFWAKASQGANIDEVGFSVGDFKVALLGAPVNSNWKQFIIPIPDPSRLTEVNVLLSYAESPENGKGYTFWIDEVKFEKLGTFANPRPAILEGQDQVFSAETGDKFPLGGLSVTYNMPNGVDQRIEAGPGYFSFTSSETSVATVNQQGVVFVIDAGAAVITATMAGIEATGSFTLESSGEPIKPLSLPPAPTISPDSVISMFCNVYTDVPIDTWNTGWQFSTAELTDIQIDGDDVKRYKKLNFVGIEFSSQPIDATEMTHFHMDIWTPDPTNLPAAFKVLLVDFGADGSFAGGDDSSHELAFTSPTLATETWVSIDVPLSDFAGLVNRAHLAQLVLSGDIPNVFVDNVYFYKSGSVVTSGPTAPAPTPTQNPADVISVYSDAYTDIPGTNFFPNWGQTTVPSEVMISGNNTLLYTGLNYQGIELGSSVDVSGMTTLHVDFWTENSTALEVFLISDSPVTEVPYSLTVPTSGWASVDIPLSSFAPVDLTDVFQFKFVGNGNVYLDNIYFHNDSGGGDEPTEAASEPTYAQGDVISVYSDSYDNDFPDVNLFPNWGQGNTVDFVMIDGNNTMVYNNLDYQGIELGNSVDVSGMDYLHLDFWTSNSTALEVFLISDSPVMELPYTLTVPTSGWASVDIPLSAFEPTVDLADVFQFKFVGNGKIYLDNILFRKDGGGGDTPTEPAPDPTFAPGDVISVFSDAYGDDIPGTDFNPFWGQATMVTQEVIDGNNTLLYTGLDYQGIQLGSNQDLSGMTHLYLNFWTANSTALDIFLISDSPTAELPFTLTVPTAGWATAAIPLTAFTPTVDLTDVFQFKFVGNGDVYIDNLLFYNDAGGATTPTEPAPDPTYDPGDVISVFSDAYGDDIPGTNFFPFWGQATVATQEMIDGNNTLLYTGLNYQGIELGSNVDVSGMTYLHLDVWTANATTLQVFLISDSPVMETPVNIPVPTSGWSSVDILLTDFTPIVDLTDVFQFKFVGDGDVYIDNILFRN